MNSPVIILVSFLICGFAFAGERQSKLNVPYGEHPKQKSDIYWDSNFEKAPILVNIHGGGWVNGDKAGFGSREFQELAITKLGCVLVSPNYRLIGDFAEGQGDVRVKRQEMAGKVDAMISDVASAVAYVQKHADEFGADPEKVIVCGSSAGGHLSAALAYCNSRDWLEGTPYAGQKLNIVGWYGDCAPLSKEFNPQIPFNADGIPFEQLDAEDPPGFMIIGTKDKLVPIQNSLQFRDKLEELGIFGQVIVCEDAGHVVGKRVVDFGPMQEPFIAFVRYALGQAEKPTSESVIKVTLR